MAVAGTVLRGIDLARLDGLPFAVLKDPEVVAFIAEMAGGAVALLLNQQQDRIVVAVDSDFAHDLEVARFLALAPQTLARARVIAGAAGRDGLLERLTVHVRNHQNATARVVLRDHRHHAAVPGEIDRGCRILFHLGERPFFDARRRQSIGESTRRFNAGAFLDYSDGGPDYSKSKAKSDVKTQRLTRPPGSCSMVLLMTSGPDPLSRARPLAIAIALSLLVAAAAGGCRAVALDAPAKSADANISASLDQFSFQIAVGKSQYQIDGYLARSGVPGPRPALLILDGSGGDARRCVEANRSLTGLGLHLACVSIPGYGRSSGPSRFVGQQAVAAARRALDLLAARKDVDPKRIAVWGLSDGAVAAGLLMDVDSRPRAVVLQSGAYDMLSLWPEARWTTKLSILRQVWPSRRVLKERSVIDHLPARLACSVLILHGERDR